MDKDKFYKNQNCKFKAEEFMAKSERRLGKPKPSACFLSQDADALDAVIHSPQDVPICSTLITKS